jgi:hypothetical protein
MPEDRGTLLLINTSMQWGGHDEQAQAAGLAFLPWQANAFTNMRGLVRHNHGRQPNVMYWAFYELGHDNRHMWAVPCKVHQTSLLSEPEHLQLHLELLTDVPTDRLRELHQHNVLKTVQVMLDQVMLDKHRGQKAAQDAAALRKRQERAAQGQKPLDQKALDADALRKTQERAAQGQKPRDQKALDADALRKRRVRAEQNAEQMRENEITRRKIKQHLETYVERHAEEVQVGCATQATAGEAMDGAEPLNPQHDPDAALALLHELNGHELSWAADHPPRADASEDELADWRSEIRTLIDSQWVKVSAVQARDLVEEKLLPKIGVQAPLYACAACGCRTAEGGYVRHDVALLPEYFSLTVEQLAAREKLGHVGLFAIDPATGELQPDGGTEDDGTTNVDLRKMVSCYQNPETEVLQHLYPNLVEKNAEDKLTVMLCSNRCAKRVAEPRCDEHGKMIPPACSLAAGLDYGSLDELSLPELSDIEKVLLGDVRMYAMVVKVVVASNKKHEEWQHTKLRAHTIFFVQSGTEAATSFLERTIDERVRDLLQKVHSTRCCPA